MKPQIHKHNWMFPVGSKREVDPAFVLEPLKVAEGAARIRDLVTRRHFADFYEEFGLMDTLHLGNEPAIPSVEDQGQVVEEQIRVSVLNVLTGAAAQPRIQIGREFADALAHQKEAVDEIRHRLLRVESLVEELVSSTKHLGTLNSSLWVPIDSFAPEPYEVLRPITAVVTSSGDEYEASFFDANLYGAGDTEEEAIADLKAVIVETFVRLSELDDEKLGPAMVKQKRVLSVHLRR